MSLVGRTAIITGASRGVGRAIAFRLAKEGANLSLMSKTINQNQSKLPGTLEEVKEQIETAEWKHPETRCYVTKLDLRSRADIKRAVQETSERYGQIDILVNNASALENSKNSIELPEKKYDLLNQINSMGTFMMTKETLPYLLKSNRARVLTLSPPINLDPEWFALGGTAYTVSKYNMSLYTLGWAKEFQGQIACNALWPLHGIKSEATHRLFGKMGLAHCHPPEMLAEAAYRCLSKEVEFSGNLLVDEYFLQADDVDITEWTSTTRTPYVPDLYVGEPSYVMKLMKLAQGFLNK